MPVYTLDHSLGGLRLALDLGKRFHPKPEAMAVRWRLGPVVLGRRVTGMLDSGFTMPIRESGYDALLDSGARVVLLSEDQTVVQVWDWWTEFGSPRVSDIKEVPVEEIKDDPELSRHLHFSSERR